MEASTSGRRKVQARHKLVIISYIPYTCRLHRLINHPSYLPSILQQASLLFSGPPSTRWSAPGEMPTSMPAKPRKLQRSRCSHRAFHLPILLTNQNPRSPHGFVRVDFASSHVVAERCQAMPSFYSPGVENRATAM